MKRKILTIMLIIPFLTMPIIAHAQNSNWNNNDKGQYNYDDELNELFSRFDGLEEIARRNAGRFDHKANTPRKSTFSDRRYGTASTY